MKSGCRVNGNNDKTPPSTGAQALGEEDFAMAVAVFGARETTPSPLGVQPGAADRKPAVDERMAQLRDLFLTEVRASEEPPLSPSGAPAPSPVPARRVVPYLLDEAVNRPFLRRLLLPVGVTCLVLFALAAATRNGTADTPPLALPAAVVQQEHAVATLEYDLSLLDLEKVEAREAFDVGDPACVVLHTAAGRPPVAVAVRKTPPKKGTYLTGKVLFTRSRFLGWEAEIFDEKENLYTMRVDRFPCKAKSKVTFSLDEKGNVTSLSPARSARKTQGGEGLSGILLDYRPLHRREIGIDYGIGKVALEKDLPGGREKVSVGVLISSDGTPSVVTVNGVPARTL